MTWVGYYRGQKESLKLGEGIRWGWIWEELGRDVRSKFYQYIMYKVLKELIKVVFKIPYLYWTHTNHFSCHLLNNSPSWFHFIKYKSNSVIIKMYEGLGRRQRGKAKCVVTHANTSAWYGNRRMTGASWQWASPQVQQGTLSQGNTVGSEGAEHALPSPSLWNYMPLCTHMHTYTHINMTRVYERLA